LKDSAAGSAKEARDNTFQAILPLRGKLLNVNKAELDKVLKSETVTNIIGSIGGGVGETFNINQVRYDKIIVMCFTGDTKVKLLNGTTKTFEELTEYEQKNPNSVYWIYAQDYFGNIVPAKATNPRITRKTKELVYVTLDNGEVIKCTKDHLFMLRNGEYVEAKELNVGESLMSLKFKNIKDNKEDEIARESFYSNEQKKWIKTYRMVAEHFVEEIPQNKVVHHIDMNKRNNNPDNLQWVTVSEHSSLHKEGLVEYNKSDNHKQRVKDLHEQGVYKNTYFGNNDYNGSLEQKQMLKELNQREDIKQLHSKNMTTYNHTLQNKMSTQAINKREDVKILQMKTKILKRVACLIRKNILFAEDIYNESKLKNIVVNVPSKKTIIKYFGSYESMYIQAMEYERKCLTEEDYNKLTTKIVNDESAQKTKRNAMANIGKRVIEQGLILNKENYSLIRNKTNSRSPKYENYNKYFNSYEEFNEYCANYNHKIVDVKFVTLDEEIPMYDFTVEQYHNFALPTSDNSSIIVHQCDADVDGSHIAVLICTLFYYYMPELLIKGMVYRVMPPLYRVIKRDNSSLYLADDSALREYRETHKNENYTVSRFKGLGEMDAQELWESTLNPETRNLKRITISDVEKAKEAFETLMGKDAELRKKFIEENSYRVSDNFTI